MFPVSDKKIKDLRSRMEATGCRELDLEEMLSRGPAVVILHRPSGLRVRCNRDRSQGLNRFMARRILVEELEARVKSTTRAALKAEQFRKRKGKPRSSGVSEGMKQFVLRPCDPSQPLVVSRGVSALLKEWGRVCEDEPVG